MCVFLSVQAPAVIEHPFFAQHTHFHTLTSHSNNAFTPRNHTRTHAQIETHIHIYTLTHTHTHTQISELSKELDPYASLWHVASEFSLKSDDWLLGSLHGLDPEAVDELVGGAVCRFMHRQSTMQINVNDGWFYGS